MNTLNFGLKTERLYLREPKMNDVDELFELMADEKITKYLTWEPHKDIETTKALVQNLIEAQENDKGYHWLLCLNETIIGIVSLIDVRRKIRTWTLNRSELSYWIGTDFQGKGFATEACKAILDFAFKNLNFHKIIVAHAAENIESKSICKKLNFTQYAYEYDAFQKNDRWNDLIWYELIK